MADAKGPEAPKGHNPVFESLVGDGSNLVGMIAYSIYKKCKREWIVQNNPTPDRIADYHETITPTALELYKNEAESRLAGFAESIMQTSADSFRREGANNEIVKAVKASNVETIGEVKRQQNFWKNLGVNLAGSLVFAFALFLFGLIVFAPGPVDFAKRIISQISAGPDPAEQTLPSK